MKMPWTRTPEPSPPSSERWIELDPVQLSNLRAELVKELRPMIRRELEASNQKLLQKLAERMTAEVEEKLQTEVNEIRSDLDEIIQGLTRQVNHLVALVEEMLEGKGEPNQDLMELAERVTALEYGMAGISKTLSGSSKQNSVPCRQNGTS